MSLFPKRNRTTADDLYSAYEAEVQSQKSIADVLNRSETTRYRIQKEHEQRDLMHINEAADRLRAMGMDELDVVDFMINAGAFNVSRVQPPQIINIVG